MSLEQLNTYKGQFENEIKQLHARHSGLKQAEGRFRQSKDALGAITPDDEGRRMLVGAARDACRCLGERLPRRASRGDVTIDAAQVPLTAAAAPVFDVVNIEVWGFTTAGSAEEALRDEAGRRARPVVMR